MSKCYNEWKAKKEMAELKRMDYEILETGSCAYPGSVDDPAMSAQKQLAVRMLAAAGMVELFGDETSYRVTDAGMAALRAEEDRLQNKEEQRAEEETAKQEERAYLDEQTKKQFRHDWRITIFSLLGGFILGVISDHFLDIVGYCSGFFRAFFK